MQDPTILEAFELFGNDRIFERFLIGERYSVQHEPGADRLGLIAEHQTPRLGSDAIGGDYNVSLEPATITQDDASAILGLEVLRACTAKFDLYTEIGSVIVQQSVQSRSVNRQGWVLWVADGECANCGPVELLHRDEGRPGFSSCAFHEPGPFLGCS